MLIWWSDAEMMHLFVFYTSRSTGTSMTTAVSHHVLCDILKGL